MTFTDNSPSAGYVAWSGVHIGYQGNNYTITDGNTNKKYIYWLLSSPTTFATSDTLPTLTDNDMLVCLNNGGTHALVQPSQPVDGAIVKTGTIGTNHLADNAITSGKLANGAVSSTKLASGAVTSTALASGAVTSTALASGAVTSGALANGAVGSSALADNAVLAAKIASGAIDSTKLAAGAVTSTAIADGAVQPPKVYWTTPTLF